MSTSLLKTKKYTNQEHGLLYDKDSEGASHEGMEGHHEGKGAKIESRKN